jgi:hypothetical protein
VRAAQERYGLRRAAPGDRTAARRPTRAESEKAQRRGWPETPRVTLRRAVSTAAAGAASEQEFFARLANAGVLVRKRLSTRNPGEVTGYSVALSGDLGNSGPVWFGGKLAADLTLPRLRERWGPARSVLGDPFTAPERNAIWDYAARTAADASAQIRSLAASDPAAAADAAWATADTLHAAAAALGSRVLRQAADSYDRAARSPFGRLPRPTPTGNSLRHAARLLAAAADVTDHRTLALVTLITRLAALAEAVAELRLAQQHAAQAADARKAAEHLHAAACDYSTPPRDLRQTRPRTAAERAQLGFPLPLRLFPAQPARHDTGQTARPGSRAPRKTRGPTR